MDTYIEYSTRGFRYAYFEYDEELSSKIKVNNLDTDILSDGKCCITTTNNQHQCCYDFHPGLYLPSSLKTLHLLSCRKNLT